MTVRPNQGAFALDAFLHQQERKSLLRFIVCGSVDHGKSTLIGRLLYEAGLLFDDELDTLAIEFRKHGTQGKELDFSPILDGSRPSASRISRSTSPIASSRPNGGSSSWRMRPATSNTRATWRPAHRRPISR